STIRHRRHRTTAGVDQLGYSAYSLVGVDKPDFVAAEVLRAYPPWHNFDRSSSGFVGVMDDVTHGSATNFVRERRGSPLFTTIDLSRCFDDDILLVKLRV